MKRRLCYLDYIKFIAMIFVFSCHFFKALELYGIRYKCMVLPYYPFHLYIGDLGVSLFFIVSGATLMYVYEDDLKLGSYFHKRFMGIYPTLWLCYFVFLGIYSYRNQFLNNGVEAWKLIFSILGIDGAIGYFGSNWFLIGEWFLGPLIALYIIFPFLRYLVNHSRYPLMLVLVSAGLGILINALWTSGYPINFFFVERIPEMFFGMVFIKMTQNRMETRTDRNVRGGYALCAIGVLFLATFMDIAGSLVMLKTYIVGSAFFFMLVYVFRRFDGSFSIEFSKKVAVLFFPFYLIHHRIIYLWTERHAHTSYNICQVYMNFTVVFLICILASIQLSRISNWCIEKGKKTLMYIKNKTRRIDFATAICVVVTIWLVIVTIRGENMQAYNQYYTSREVESLPQLTQGQMISEEEYGSWIGRSGICLDTCNDRQAGNEVFPVCLSERSTEIIGWGGDFNTNSPFLELYLVVGDHIFRCNYGIERQSVVDVMGIESLRYTGFSAEINNDVFEGGNIDTVSFVAVSSDGQSIYEPVTYPVRYE